MCRCVKNGNPFPDRVMTLVFCRFEDGVVSGSGGAAFSAGIAKPRRKPCRAPPGDRPLIVNLADLRIDEAGDDMDDPTPWGRSSCGGRLQGRERQLAHRK